MNDEEALDRYYSTAEALLKSGKPCEALDCTLAALAICDDSVETLLQAGELCLLYGSDMGMAGDFAEQQALTYFDRLLAIEGQHAAAWSGKAFAELYLNRPDAALVSIERGFACIKSGIGFGMGFEPVNTNVLESLFRCRILALVELGRREEARQVLAEGLRAVPQSRYLTSLTEEFQPELSDGTRRP